jgi:hypothetical protein
VDDLFADVDWRAESLERDADDINRPDHAGTEAARLE